jgi:hypothetical protein
MEPIARRIVGGSNIRPVRIAGRRRQELVDRGIAAREKLLDDVALENDHPAIGEGDNDLAVDNLDMCTREIDGKADDRGRIEIDFDTLARRRQRDDDWQCGIGQRRDLRADPISFTVRNCSFRFRASRFDIHCEAFRPRSRYMQVLLAKFTDQAKFPQSRFGAYRRMPEPCREVKMAAKLLKPGKVETISRRRRAEKMRQIDTNAGAIQA